MESHPVTKLIPLPTWNLVAPHFSTRSLELLADLCDFVTTRCIPAEKTFHAQIPSDPSSRFASYPKVMEELKAEARSRGLWNLFLPKRLEQEYGSNVTTLEYAVMAEVMGRSIRVAPEACNCSAPDTGNMEVFAKFGTPQQKDKYLLPLLRGEARSSFAMTEKGVASSDATNIQTSIRPEGNDIVINGHKWWISGAGDPRNNVHLVMGKSDPKGKKHAQQSIVIVPPSTPGVTLVRPMQVFGYDDAPEGHFEVIYDNVRVPKENLIAGWGRGFEVIQSRLQGGRIHHCMRSIGAAERALDLMVARVSDPERKTFGRLLREHGTIIQDIAKSRCDIDQARLLVYAAAHQMDTGSVRQAIVSVAEAKAVIPKMVGEVIDRAMQAFGAEGISQDTPLAAMFAGLRTLRYADGPDEVHLRQIGLAELAKLQRPKL